MLLSIRLLNTSLNDEEFPNIGSKCLGLSTRKLIPLFSAIDSAEIRTVSKISQTSTSVKVKDCEAGKEKDKLSEISTDSVFKVIT